MFNKGKMPPTIVTLDAGNNNLQMVVLYNDGNTIKRKEFLIPHGFVRLNETQWAQAKREAQLSRMRNQLTQTFKIHRGDAVQIGLSALRSRYNNPQYGNVKYRKGGIDALMLALLLEAFPAEQYPDGHDNLIVGFGFPPSEWKQTETVAKLLVGKHTVEQPSEVVSGKDTLKRSFHVRATLPYDEIVGGIVYSAARHKQQPRDQSGRFKSKNVFAEGLQILAVDAGGRLGSMGWVKVVNGFPDIDYPSFQAIDGGAITVRDELRKVLKANYPTKLQSMRHVDMTDDWLDSILETGVLRIKGVEHDASGSIQDSLAYIEDIRQLYRNHFAEGIQADMILLSGGTTKPLYNYLVEMFNHDNIVTADTLNRIVWANVRGGEQIVLDALLINNMLPDQYRQAMGVTDA